MKESKKGEIRNKGTELKWSHELNKSVQQVLIKK